MLGPWARWLVGGVRRTAAPVELRHYPAIVRDTHRTPALAHAGLHRADAFATALVLGDFFHSIRGLAQLCDDIAAHRPGSLAFAFDQRNHGDSPRLPVPDWAAMLGDMDWYVRRTQLYADVPVLLVGLGPLGARLAVELALRHPTLAHGVVLVGALPLAHPPECVDNMCAVGRALNAVDFAAPTFRGLDYADAGREAHRQLEALGLVRARLQLRSRDGLTVAAQEHRQAYLLVRGNLAETRRGFRWRTDVSAVLSSVPALLSAPPPALAAGAGRSRAPLLLLAAEESRFARREDEGVLDALFEHRRAVRVASKDEHLVPHGGERAFAELLRFFAEDLGASRGAVAAVGTA